jgi:hypothetical protein
MRYLFLNFLTALIIRIIFTCYGVYFDSQKSVNINDNYLLMFNKSISIQNLPKYTDIDYKVFTDASSYVYQVRNILHCIEDTFN